MRFGAISLLIYLKKVQFLNQAFLTGNFFSVFSVTSITINNGTNTANEVTRLL